VIGTVGYLTGVVLLVMGTIGVLALDHSNTSDASHALLAASGAVGRHTAEAHWQGVALAIASGLLFACYGLAVRKCMDGVNSVLAFATICQYTAAVMVGLMLAFGRDAGLSVLEMSGTEIRNLLISAVIGIAIGHVFYYLSIARLGVAVTAGVLQLQPFIVAVGSMFYFNEGLGSWQWAGGCIAVSGALTMLWVQWRMSRRIRAIEEPVAIAEGESGA
jgi:drug/metabolite transporter (DMT)-like permease